ncbi:hypothetical protein WJX74_008180 [Apatococcus lobatus]|uniref:NAD-dependent epimerase/dehydratase domain-containing protein n=2 Tax=Apatococcus TaxID=904362 RepID=A0AAW1S8M1_9CHLO
MLRSLRTSGSIKALTTTILQDCSRESLWQAPAAAALCQQQRNLEGLALINKGTKAGPGGRSSISGVTATIFGCSGFLGRYLTNYLARAGSQCVVPHRADEVNVQYLKQMGDLGMIVQLKDFDMRSDEAVREAISRSNVVVNCLGADKETMNFSYEEVHVDFAERIARACADSDVLERLLHVSCLAASPGAPSRRLTTKAEGDRIIREIYPKATIFKAAHMTGVEDRLLNNFANLAKKLPFMPLVDGGHTLYQPTYVRDVTEAMMNSLKTPNAVGQTYHLAGPETYTIQQLMQLTLETIREPYHEVYVPRAIAKAITAPREYIYKKLPVPVNYMFTSDWVDELQVDATLPQQEGLLTYKDLNVLPRRIDEGVAIEHIRYYRVGGYDLGTTGTGQAQQSGGAGFGGQSF